MGDPTARQDKFVELQEKKAEEKKLEETAEGAEKPEAKQEERKAKAEKKEERKEKKREVVLERVYAVNLSSAYAKPKMARANAATRILRDFLCRHMKSPAEKTRVSPALNDAIRARGSGRPLKKVKLRATKDKDGMVLAELTA